MEDSPWRHQIPSGLPSTEQWNTIFPRMVELNARPLPARIGSLRKPGTVVVWHRADCDDRAAGMDETCSDQVRYGPSGMRSGGLGSRSWIRSAAHGLTFGVRDGLARANGKSAVNNTSSSCWFLPKEQSPDAMVGGGSDRMDGAPNQDNPLALLGIPWSSSRHAHRRFPSTTLES